MMKLRRENIERIVVRGTNWVGDTVISVAALRRLRQLFPEAQITLVIRSSAAALFLESNFIDKVLPYDRRGLISVFKQIAEFRQQRFDLAVLFQNAFEAALIPFLARVPIRVGYATDGRRHLLTHSFPLPEWREQKHEVFYYLNIVDQLERLVNATSTHSEDKVDYSLTVSGPRQSQIHQRLDTCLSRKGPTVVLCPGSINSRAKRWPAERYAKLADRLIEEQNANVLFVGSKGESQVAAEVRSFMKHQPVDLIGGTDLAEAIAIISLADLVVSNDTGPAHIASALGRPTVVIFGPTNPLTTRPFAKAARVIRQPPECAPCMLRDCPIDHRCMTAISVDEVLGTAVDFLETARALPRASAKL